MKTIGFWILYFTVACICQWLGNDFPSAFFAFPINAALLLLWFTATWILFREKRHAFICRTLLKKDTTIILLTAFCISCLLMGLIPQDAAASDGVTDRMGLHRITSTWWFVAMLFALLAHLFFVIIKGISSNRPHRLRFALNHIGMFLALAGGFLGHADVQDLRMLINTRAETGEAYDLQGNQTVLNHRFKLLDFHTEYYPNGAAREYQARLSIDDTEAVLKVNHPYSLAWNEDLYLTGGNSSDTQYCVVQ